jgi:hypothetical protein
MVRKTRKHSKSEVHTIPQLRRLFENIEEFVDSRIQKHEAKDKLSKELQKEWKRVFMKELEKKHADAFVEDRMKSKRVLRHTIKKGGAQPLVGGAQPLVGAPLDYSTRQGIYLAPNSIPVNGQLPLSNMQGIQSGIQNGGGYGSYVDYVNSGFWNPEDSSTYDPIEGQQPWPQPYASTGSNEVKGLMKGGKFKKSKKSRKVRGGNALLTQAFTRPIGSNAPPSILQDMQSMAYGQQMGPSPDQVQRPIAEVHSMYKTPIF